jgi:hypothetical protein
MLHFSFYVSTPAIDNNKPGSRCPYVRMDDLIVTGLPAGVDFRKPASYGADKLNMIKLASDNICIKGYYQAVYF